MSRMHFQLKVSRPSQCCDAVEELSDLRTSLDEWPFAGKVPCPPNDRFGAQTRRAFAASGGRPDLSTSVVVAEAKAALRSLV